MQGGLYGRIITYDPDNLDQPAVVEIAPGVDIRVHSQAILRVVNPTEGVVTEDEFIEAEVDQADYVAGVANGDITSLDDDHRIAAADAEQATRADADKKRRNEPEA